MNTEDTLPDNEILEKRISRLTYLADFTCFRLKIDNNCITFIKEQKSADEYSLKCATNGDKPKDYIWQYVHKKLSANGNVTKNANQRLFWMRNSIYLVKKFWTLGCLIPRNEMMHVIETGISSIDAYVCLQKLFYDDYYFPPKNERNFTKVRLTPYSKFFIPTNVCYILIANQPAIFKLISDKPEYSKLVEMKNLLNLAMEENSRVEKPTGMKKNVVTVDSSTECAGVDQTIDIDASSTECTDVDGTIGNSVCCPSTECTGVDKTIKNSIYPSMECPSVDKTIRNSVCYPSTECPSVDKTIKNSVCYPSTECPAIEETIKNSVYPSTECPAIEKTIKNSVYPSTECPGVKKTIRNSVYPSTKYSDVDKTIRNSIYPPTESPAIEETIRNSIYPPTESPAIEETIRNSIYPPTECPGVDKTNRNSVYPPTECRAIEETNRKSVYPPTECRAIEETNRKSVYPPTDYGDEITIVYSTPGGKKMSPKKTSEQKTSRDKIMFYSGARGTSTDKTSGGDHRYQDKITLYSTHGGGKTVLQNVGTAHYDERTRIDVAGCSHEGYLDSRSKCNLQHGNTAHCCKRTFLRNDDKCDKEAVSRSAAFSSSNCNKEAVSRNGSFSNCNKETVSRNDDVSNYNFDTNDISIADLPCIELSDVANELLMDYNYNQCKSYCFETITP